MKDHDVDVLVIGAGLSGLALAHQLKRAGKSVRLLEAAPLAGGNIGTSSRYGFLLERGPNGFLAGEPAMGELVESLKLGPQLRSADLAAERRFVVRRGALVAVPQSPPDFLKSNLLPLHAKVRVLLEPLLAKRGPLRDESLGDFARRHVGRFATGTLVDAVQTGIYAGDVEKLSAGATFPKLKALESEHRSLLWGAFLEARKKRQGAPEKSGPTLPRGLSTFERGMGALTGALTESLEAELTLQFHVTSIWREEDGWRAEASGQFPWSARRLVLATPTAMASVLVGPHHSALSEELSAIEYAPLAVVHLEFKGDVPKGQRGFGFLVPSSEGLPLLGAIDVGATFPFRVPDGHLLWTCLMGGARAPELLRAMDDELVQQARATLKGLVGELGQSVFSEVIRWPRAIPQYQLGHLARLQRIANYLPDLPGLYLLGNGYEGVGVNDCVRTAKALADRMASEGAGP